MLKLHRFTFVYWINRVFSSGLTSQNMERADELRRMIIAARRAWSKPARVSAAGTVWTRFLGGTRDFLGIPK